MYHAALSWKRGMAQGMRIIRGDDDTPHHHGDTSHFQALATARSGTPGSRPGHLIGSP